MIKREINRYIPVLLGNNYEHIMARADIVEEGDEITVTIKAKGGDALDLAEVFTSSEPLALSFVAIPVKPHSSKKETPQ